MSATRGGCAFLVVCGALCLNCQEAGNVPGAVAESAGVLLDSGKGYQLTIIVGDATQQTDRFLVPSRSAAVDLWSGGQQISATHTDLNGHFVFTETLLNGEYVVKMPSCPDVEAHVAVLAERRLKVALQLPARCAKN
jgi:predicted aspartyl protease